MRAKNLRVGYCKSHLGQDRTAEKKWDASLQLYRDARRQGVQPDSTREFAVRGALEHSERTGVAYNAGNGNAGGTQPSC